MKVTQENSLWSILVVQDGILVLQYFQVADLREKYAVLKENYVTNRSSTKRKLTEYIEKDAGVKLTKFHNQLKAFRADLSKQHVVSLS